MPNPFQQGAVQPPKPQNTLDTTPQPQPQSNNPFQQQSGQNEPQAQADIFTPTNQPQKPLPDGAIGLDAGGNPMFKDSLGGVLQKWKYNFTKDIQNVSADDWNTLKQRWQNAMNPQYVQGGRFAKPGDLTPEQQQAAQQNNQDNIAGVAGQAVSKTWQANEAQGSLLAPVLKGVSASVTAIGDLFSMPAKRVEQGIGAVQGFSEAAQNVDSPLPRLDGNNFTKGIENTPVGLAYDAARIALSPSDNKWQDVKQSVTEGWNSGRILYSQVFNQSLKEDFLRQYRAGEDPQLIAEKLQNPFAELGGQLLLDPLNLVGAFAKGAKTAKELEAASEAVKASGLLKTEEGAKALEMIGNAQDDATAAEAMKTLVTAQQKAVADVQSSSRLLNVTYAADSLTTSSRQNALIGKGKELLGNMALILKQNGMSYDGVTEAILYGMKSVSKDENVMREGLAGLAHLPNANMWLSDDHIETFTMLHNLMADEQGVLNGSKLKPLMLAANPAEFADGATKLLIQSAKQEFPDVQQMAEAAQKAAQASKNGLEVTDRTAQLAKQYEALPNHVNYLNQINEAVNKFRTPINNVLSYFYFNLQGGVAVKNVVANNELIFLDKGIGAWFKDGEFLSKEKNINYLKDTFGELPQSAHGFTSLVNASTNKEPALFGKLMQAGEEEGAARIVAASVRDTMDAMMPKALTEHFTQAVSDGTMTQAQADKFVKLATKNGGNLDKALNEFRDFYKLGATEKWRNLDFVTDFQKNALDKMGYWQDIEDLAHNGAASTSDVESLFNKINNSIDTRSSMAVNDVVGLSNDHPGAPAWGDLIKAVEDGYLNPEQHQVLTAIMESAEQARLNYQKLLDDVSLKAMTSLGQEGRIAESEHIGNEMNRVRQILRQSGPQTAKDAQAITQDAWRWSDAVKAEKRPTTEFFQSIWKKAGLNGDVPADLDKQTLMKELWDQRFKKVTDLWNGSLDAVVGESETVLKQLEGTGAVDVSELQQMAQSTRNVTEQAQALRTAVFQKKLLRIRPNLDAEYMAKQLGLTTEDVLMSVNKKVNGDYRFLKDVPTAELKTTFEDLTSQKKGSFQEMMDKMEGVAVPPPQPMGSDPSFPRAWNESSKGAKYTLDSIKQNIMRLWGQTDDARQYNPAMEAALKQAISEASPKMAEIKATALKVANEQRNFTLLNYGEKTYADVAKAYVMPYHFFYTRSYQNWMRRIAENPQIVSGYAKYKNALEGINKDLPDWYKQQLNINPLADNPNMQGKTLLGIPLDHPLYINLEASLNPLYGLTGTDFNDPAKRTDWATATMDDMGKFGPTLWAPIQMAIAAKLYTDGNTDAASRWASRLIPETAQVKAVSSMFGKPIELDPSVNFFSGGIDPYERGRMGYAAAQLVQEGQYTPEQVQEAFQQQSGPIWDKAYQMAVQSRAASSLTSYFLGVGFKPRSQNDVMVEDMYTKLNKLYAMSDYMSGDQFKQAQEQLRSQYPDGLVETVLLAKKGGDQRDAAYAYNVLGRLPPGDMTGVFKAIGISSQDVSKFYDSKGFTDPKVSYTATEKQRFMAAIVDMGAMLKIPDNATKQEWNDARSVYSADLEQIAKQVGMPYEKDANGKVTSRGVWDEISHYYDLKDQDKQAAADFQQQHPEIQAALQLKGQAVAESPILSAYYGGIDQIEAYISGNVRQQLSQKYGQDIYQKQTDYFNATNPKAYLAAHPELKRFWTDKRVLDSQTEQAFMQMASRLPQGKPAQFQPGFTPQSGVQQTMYDALQPKSQVPAWEDVSQGMPQWLQQEVQNHLTNGSKLSARGEKEMTFLAQQQGFYNSTQMLQTASLALQQYYGGGQAQSVSSNPFAQQAVTAP